MGSWLSRFKAYVEPRTEAQLAVPRPMSGEAHRAGLVGTHEAWQLRRIELRQIRPCLAHEGDHLSFWRRNPCGEVAHVVSHAAYFVHSVDLQPSGTPAQHTTSDQCRISTSSRGRRRRTWPALPSRQSRASAAACASLRSGTEGRSGSRSKWQAELHELYVFYRYV